MSAQDNLNPKQFRFRRVDYKDSEGMQSHDFVLEHGTKKLLAVIEHQQKALLH
jgi:type I site-specific restriction endonuclease